MNVIDQDEMDSVSGVDYFFGLKFKIDTARCNILPVTTHEMLLQKKQKSKVKLVSYFGHRVTPLGKSTLLCEHKDKYYDTEVHIISENVKPLLELETWV